MSVDIVGKIIDYESGELSAEETLQLFAELIKSGAVWSLQGSYGRMAAGLIEGGIISPEGEIAPWALDQLEDDDG